MRGRIRSSGRTLAIVIAGLALAAPASASAEATITVEPAAGQNTFAPTRVIRTLSEARFTWIWGAGGAGTVEFHDVVSDGALFDSGEAVKQGSFEVDASAGSYRYFCSIHFGMNARVSVRPEAEEGSPGPFRVSWATPESETGKRYDVRFKLEGRRWRSWLQNTRKRSAIFNATDQAAAGVARRTVLIQARSEITERKASAWSPALRITS